MNSHPAHIPQAGDRTRSVNRRRIYLVDDHPLVREHLSLLIGREPDLCVCGEAADAPTAFREVACLRPAAVIVDLSLRDSHGLALVKDLKSSVPGTPLLVLSMHNESVYALRALRAGAMGYVSKLASSDEILQALRTVLSGDVHLSAEMQRRVVQMQAGKPRVEGDLTELLSDRELEVFQLLGKGLGTRRISEVLRIGIKSVEGYRARIKLKLGISDAPELLFRAIQWVDGAK